jgi:integrase
MKGTMRERRPGAWELIVQLPRDAATGRPKQLSRTVRGTKREAQRALAALVTEVTTTPVSTTTVNLAELLDRWLDAAGGGLSPTTAHEYRRLADVIIKPALGRVVIRRLSAQRLDEFYSALGRERGLSASSVRQVHAVIRGALSQSVKWGWLASNPALSASPPRLRRHEITPPDVATALRLLAAADDYDPDFGALLRVLASTGARRGEVCALRWTDVDLDAGTLVIRRSIAKVPQGMVEKDTKTHAARRIAIDEHTAQLLNAHHEKMRARAALCRAALREDGYVFSPDVDGASPLHPNLVSGRFRGVCRHLGVSGVRLHDLRHLHATQLLAAGVPVRTVSGRLGHADAATTLNVYAHFLQASDRQAADVISELLHPR